MIESGLSQLKGIIISPEESQVLTPSPAARPGARAAYSPAYADEAEEDAFAAELEKDRQRMEAERGETLTRLYNDEGGAPE